MDVYGSQSMDAIHYQQPGTSAIADPQPVSLITFLRSNGDKITDAQRRGFKDKRPTPKLDMFKSVLVTNRSTPHNRFFQASWYARFPWLTGCNEANKMFCFKCLLFGTRNDLWVQNGISELQNFIKKAFVHQRSKKHLLNEERFHLLDISNKLPEKIRLQGVKYNDEVRSNREVLGHVIQAILYLSTNKLFLGADNENENQINKDNYLPLLNVLAQYDSKLRDHLNSSSAFQLTSPEIRIKLIEAITFVVNEEISEEIQQTHFVSIQADETQDVSCKRQISLVLRYCIKERIVERFIGFYDLPQENSAAGLSKIVIDVLKRWNIPGAKVISQTYDGPLLLADSVRNSQVSNTGSMQFVQHLVRQDYCPHALFVHSYAHEPNSLILHGLKNIKEVRLFICDLSSFESFFNEISRRMTMLEEKGFILLKENQLKWNFQTQAIPTIIHFFTDLHQLFDSIIEDTDGIWDCYTISCAKGLKRTMEDPTFVFLLFVFESCSSLVNNCFSFLLSLSKIYNCQNDLILAVKKIKQLQNKSFVEECFEKSMILNKTLIFTDEATQKITYSTYEIFFDDRKKLRLHSLTYEILDTIVTQLETRFADIGKLSFVEIVTEWFASTKIPKTVTSHSATVKDRVADLLKVYPHFELEKLVNELHVVYLDKSRYIEAQKLLAYLFSTGLNVVHVEVVKLLQLVLAIPIVAPNVPDNISKLDLVKSYLLSCMADDRLSNVSLLAVEKEFVTDLSSNPSFISRVIDVFAERNNRKDLVYKRL